MNYRQVEIFKAIMDSGSITGAADILRISQPAVTKALRLLELDLGLQLFVRTTKGIAATDEARALYAEVERTYFGMQNLKRFAGGLRDSKQGRVVVTAIPTLSVDWLPTMAARFAKAHPGVTLSLYSDNSADAVRLVGSGEIDIGIAQIRSEETNLSRRKLFDLEGLIALPAGHRLGEKDSITADDLAGEPIIALGPADEFRRRLVAAMEAAGAPLRSVIDVSLGLTVCAMVERGLGVGVVDSETARVKRTADLVFRPFEPKILVPIYMFRQRQRQASSIAEAFSASLQPPPPFRIDA
ncbi:LysR family transcriptional regulator [Alsobacter soli]|uniref:LysR family transcriptional regulator n=1 Tax=Alsobacter soli TaxID=2109933 RepID=A0A2T1HUD6_9HYPH|nr:LysR substrate-binding domain-containing protein [Alsobacter soli]PSC05267.1 LysR family transcriptional regulator [Alsobacter soli]